MHIHILGICGTFMGGVAALAREAGHTVTGCDAGVYPPMSDQLRALGIDLIEGFGADQTALKPDMYVIGNVVKRPGDFPIGHLLYRPVSLFLFQRFDQIIIVFLEFVQLICQVQSRQDRNFGN